MPTVEAYNQLGHPIGAPGSLMAAAASGTVAGTVIPGAGAGVGATTSIASGQNINDAGGSFTLAAAGTPAAGVIATVNLFNPYPAQSQPVCTANVTDTTSTLAVAASAIPVVASGQVSQINIIGPALTAAHNYNVQLNIQGSPGSD